MSKEEAKVKLAKLIDEYNATLRNQNRSDISEETVRTWLNSLLLIFGWDVKNVSQVRQEKKLRGESAARLIEINSTYNKPDYALINGNNIKAFVDAKNLGVDIFTDTEVAFQIRSYGWSAQTPCSFVSNFEQFVIYDTTFVPDNTQPANYGVKQFTVDEYLEHFDELYEHLFYDYVCSNHLEEIYETADVEGTNRLDDSFMDILSQFRISLAQNLFENNPSIICTDEALNYYTQVILDRIVFIRVCESKGIEQQEKLRSFATSDDGFWNSFKSSCYMEFYSHYDGAMFDRDDYFQNLVLENSCFEDFIRNLYYPSPYRFDVIPVKVIAGIYEVFLGKHLVIDNGSIREETKDDYVKTQGAIATPEHIVDMVCKQTLMIDNIKTINDLFDIKILDACCGSGIFIVSCYELLCNKAISIFQNSLNERKQHPRLFCVESGEYYLTICGRRELVKKCLYSIDCDEAAIEVTKMSLALKIVDGDNPLVWNNIGAYGDRILQDVANNVVLGNTLVSSTDNFTAEQIERIKPLNIHQAFSSVFVNGGFDYVIGNPPYVETKHYKAALPKMHEYLQGNYESFSGKADLAVLFIERGLQLLNNQGRLGYIIQRRWFKTDYGNNIRKHINDHKYLEKMIEFTATDIFKKRTVYAAILVLSKAEKAEFQYYKMKADASEIKTLFENSDAVGNFMGCNYTSIPGQTGTTPWSFGDPELLSIRQRLLSSNGALKLFPNLKINDGIQVLYKNVYDLRDVQFSNGIATGINGFGETVSVEENMVRAVIFNNEFYPFKQVQPDAYCIFPYEGASTQPITIEIIRQDAPLTYNYLSRYETLIRDKVKCNDGNLWHTYTRVHNQTLYNINKIIIPMTARDTIATYVSDRGLYMDNANVWFITVDNAEDDLMKAIACIVNSTTFSVMGKLGANPQSGGYYKFNKQFLAPIPFPSTNLISNTNDKTALSNLYDEIYELEQRYLTSIPSRRTVLRQALDNKWEQLDAICDSLYGLLDDEKLVINGEGRTVNRVELLDGVN